MQPLTPNEPALLQFDLYAMSYIFEAGHRIRLTLSFADGRATEKVEPAPQLTIQSGAGMQSALVLPLI